MSLKNLPKVSYGRSWFADNFNGFIIVIAFLTLAFGSIGIFGDKTTSGGFLEVAKIFAGAVVGGAAGAATFDLFAIVKRIVDAGGQFRSLAEPWADTATSTGRLMIAVLGGLADVERDLIRTRTAEGRRRAKARGQHMGRPPALTAQQQAEARQRRSEGATLKELAQSYNVGIATISRLSKEAA